MIDMEILYLTEKHKLAWEDLVVSTPESGFMQSWAWGEFKEAQKHSVIRLGVFDDERLIAGTAAYYVPSSLGSSPLELPHGPVLPWGAEDKAAECMKLIAGELGNIAERIGAPAARIEPLISSKMPGYIGKLVRAPVDLIPTPTLIIQISGADEEILSSMTHKGRYNIKRALTNGVEVYCSESEESVNDFYFLFELTYNKHYFQGEPFGFFRDLINCLGPKGMARIYFARYKGVLISAAVVIFYGRTATYLYGGNSPFFSSSMASYAMHWRMMTDARALGCRFYDLYGIAPEGKPFHPYARFSQFKERFGGRKVTTAGAHDIYFYSQLAGMWADSVEGIEADLLKKEK